MSSNTNVNSQVTCANRSLPWSSKRGALGLLGLLLLSACSNDPPPGVITIKTGGEPNVWTVEPLAQDVFVEMVEVETNKRATLAKVPAPASSITIGPDGPSGLLARFEATAYAADSNQVMRGTSIPFWVNGIAGVNIPVFMGRTGGLSRAPEELLFARRHPQPLLLSAAYLLISGGDGAENAASLDVYDLVRWAIPKNATTGKPAKQPPLPKVPESWAALDPKLLLIDHAGATWLDLSTDLTSDAPAPEGLDYALIVGGKTFVAPDHTQYIVGGTRLTGEPTNQVLRIDPGDDTKPISLHLMQLGTPRLGAAAAIVNGQLLVVGGSGTGAGAEISNAAGTNFTSLAFPADARQGAALLAQGETSAILAGGRDPESDEISGFRTLDLSCSANCTQVEIENADFAFDYPQLFALGGGQLLAVGEDPTSQETHVFTFETRVGLDHAMNEYALRVPRTGASAVMLPNGQVAVLGGDALSDDSPALTLELFFPAP